MYSLKFVSTATAQDWEEDFTGTLKDLSDYLAEQWDVNGFVLVGLKIKLDTMLPSMVQS